MRLMIRAALTAALALAFWACSNPVGGNSKKSNNADPIPTYLSFEEGTPSFPENSTLSMAGDNGFFSVQNPDTQAASPSGSAGTGDASGTPPNPTISKSTEQAKVGTGSVKIEHIFRNSRYIAPVEGHNVLMSSLYLRVGSAGTGAGLLASIPGTVSIPATSPFTGSSYLSSPTVTQGISNRGITLAYKLNLFIPADSKIDKFGLVLYDVAQNPLQSHYQGLTKGAWNRIVFYVKGAQDKDTLLTEVTETGSKQVTATVVAVKVNGADGSAGTDYVGGAFDPSGVRFFGLRTFNTDGTATAGDALTYYVDDFGWLQTTLAATAPVPSVSAGTYDTAQTVSLSSTTAGAAIWYTTDGTNPKTSETKTQYSTPLSITETTTLKSYAAKSGFDDSEVVSTAYVISPLPPVYSLTNPGPYDTNQNLGMSTTTSGASVYYNYTTNGDTPAAPTSAETGTLYSGTVTLTLPANGSKTYKFSAVSIKDGLPVSAATTASFVLSPPNTSLAPPFTVNSFESDTAGTTTYTLIANPAAALTANVVTLANVWTTASTPGTTTGNSSANVLAVPSTGYNQYALVNLTIPEGHTLSEYGTIKVSAVFPNNTGDNGYKTLNAFIGTSLADGDYLSSSSASYMSGASTGGMSNTWTDYSIAIDSTKAATITATSLKLALGISRSGLAAGPYYLDNIQLIPKAVGVTTFESDTAGTTTYPVISGTAGAVTAGVVTLANVWTTASTPGTTTNNSSANVLAVPSTGYNQYAKIRVDLPQGTVLSSYGYVSVKAVFPNNGGDNGYKTLNLFVAGSLADGQTLMNVTGTASYMGASSSTGAMGTAWVTYLIPIDSTKAANVTEGTVDVALGISRSGGATGPFYLDDIGFVPK